MCRTAWSTLVHRILWTSTAFLSAAAVGLAITWAGADAPAHQPSPADERAWTYVWPEDRGFRDLPGRFNLPLVVTLAGRSPGGNGPDPAVRVVLHAEGSQSGEPPVGLLVEARRTELRLCRLEGGVAIERWSGPCRTGETARFEIKRRGSDLAVTLDGRLAVRASEPAFSGGRVAVAFAGGGRAKLGSVSRLTELAGFSDDFMRTPEEPGPWDVRSGEWMIETLPTPSMSANGFSYRGRSVDGAGGALSLAGNATWDQYRFAASVRGETDEALGLVIAARPDAGHVLFRWTSREGGPEGEAEPGLTGLREIVSVELPASGFEEGTPPVEEVLAAAPGGYIPGQWYRVEVELEFGRARVLVDGHELLTAGSPDLTSGLVGLWSSGAVGARFDDVLVAPCRSIEAEFGPAGTSEAPRRPGPEWEALGGEWIVEGGSLLARELPSTVSGGGRLALVERRTRQGEAEAKLLTGPPSWRRFTVRTELDAPRGGGAGIVANYRDEENYVLLKAEGRSRFSLECVRAGRRETLATSPRADTDRQAVVRGAGDGPAAEHIALELMSDRGYLAGRVNGELLLEGRDEELIEGRAGLWVSGKGGATGKRFHNFRSDLIMHRPPVNVVNRVFEMDDIMSDWAGESADWYLADSGPGQAAHWYRAPLCGDTELALDLPEGASHSGRLVLSVSKTPDHPKNGYAWEFVFSPTEPEGATEAELSAAVSVPGRAQGTAPTASVALGGGSGPHGRLWREDEIVDEAALDSGQRLDSLFIRRQGSHVVAGVNGGSLVHLVDPDPLPGGRVAYLVDGFDGGVDLKPSRARLYGGAFFDYLFASAPVEWRSAAGLWEVTSRWDCDMRWSFFVGRYDLEDPSKAAIAWSKRSFPRDVIVDFFVAPWMEGEHQGQAKRGRRYEYIRDINVTIAADGRDPTTGYTFTFGGFGNTVSAILRGDGIVAEDRRPQALMPRNMRIHQRWHHVRVERKGSLLHYTVDFERTRKVDLQYEDPDPLKGDRIAIWTYDCGNVYARLRIAASEGGALEHPDFIPPAVTRTLYDDEAGRAGGGAEGEGDE
jgi:hypothetical protein